MPSTTPDSPVITRIKKLSTMDNLELFFYGIYASKYNKETMMNLKYEMTFLELQTHKQFVDTQDDLEEEANKRALAEGKR